VHDIIGDIIDWDKAYLVGADQTGERYNQRLEAARRMAEIEARWQHLPEGFEADQGAHPGCRRCRTVDEQ